MKHTKNCLEGGKCDCAREDWRTAYWADFEKETDEKITRAKRESWNYPVPLWFVVTLVGVALCLSAFIACL